MPEPQALVEASASLSEIRQGQPNKGRFKTLLIRAGWGSSGYYSEAVLKRDGPKAWPVGTRMHLDHQTEQESLERPEGSVTDWASEIVTTPAWDPTLKGLVAEVQVFPQWRDLLNEEFAPKVGLSIRAFGKAEYGEAEGREGAIITSLDEGISVDWVTRAGAGGRVLQLIESARQQSQGLLREAVEARVRPKGAAEAGDDAAATVREAAEQIRTYAVALVEAEDRRLAAADASEAKAPPFKPKDDPDDEDDTGDSEPDDDDEDEDDDKPPFLKGKKVKEARNVGHWLESRIHAMFTQLADDMFGEGRLTREERISLSNAIGEGLTAFNATVADKVPHLYERDLWDEPTPPERPAQVVETTTDTAPPEVADPKNEPGSSPADNTDKEGEMPELTEAQARELEEARTVAENDKAAALAEAETARREAAESALKLARFTALEAGRPIATQVLAESSLPPAAQAKILATVTSESIPLTAENLLDEAALKTFVEESAKTEAAYLASLAEADGAGTPRLLGESTTATPSAPSRETVTALEETYRSRGLSPEAAKLAAAGRP
jgi:hypothetical protein